MRTLPLVMLLVACTPDGPKDAPGADSGAPPGAPTGTGAPTSGDRGVVAWWVDDDGSALPRQALIGVFAPHFDGLAAPALCGMGQQLCVASLPAASELPTPWVDSTFDPREAPMIWVGDQIDVSGFRPAFSVDAETGWAGYALSVPGTPLPRLDLTLGGEWGAWSAAGVVPVVYPIAAVSPAPGTILGAAADLDFAWLPSGDPTAELFLEVDAPPTHVLWRLDDDGAFSLPAAELPEPSPTGPSTIRLHRRAGAADHRDGDHVVTGEGWSTASWPYGGGGNSTCQALLATDPTTPTGVHVIQPDPAGPSFEVWCDMDTDGGGWTLVASSRDDTFDDQGVAWQSTLTTTSPGQAMTGIWQGLRSALPAATDLRFSCKQDATSPTMTVDLSFYAVDWYGEFTQGSDAQSCFSEDDGAGAGAPPARRDNVSGAALSAGDGWNSGFLEGEDACSSTDDFTVDLDDRGMDGNERDGTDWGEDDGVQKCGDATVSTGGAWFVWVR